MRLRLFTLLILNTLVINTLIKIQDPPPKILIPIGGGYRDNPEGFWKDVLERQTGSTVRVLVLPIAYASHSETISIQERTQNLADAEIRRQELDAACQANAQSVLDCSVVLAPVFVRRDAQTLPIPQFFPTDLTGIFILGGNQAVAAQLVKNTPLEAALEEAYRRGVIIAGTSAGAAIQSKAMLAGYQPGFDQRNALNFGAVDLWYDIDLRGLSFGIDRAILDQHFYQRGRLPRLLNAIALPGVPSIGVGIDAYTGIHISDGYKLERVFGDYTVTVLDAETYHSADAVRYIGPGHITSMRNVLVHLLPPGNPTYDLRSRVHASRVFQPTITRTVNGIALPPSAGPLYLGGDLRNSLDGSPIVTDFVNAAGGNNARILIIAAGYSSRSTAQREATYYASALGVTSQIRIIENTSVPLSQISGDITGILMISDNSELVDVNLLPAVRPAWLAGMPVLTDKAATALVGRYYAALASAPESEAESEAYTQGTFILGNVEIRDGLKLLNILSEPRVMGDMRWGPIFALAFNHSGLPAIGISEGSALVITPYNAKVWGENAVFILDLSTANRYLGDNRAFGIMNGFLDIFGPGDEIRFRDASVAIDPIRAATPILPTETPSATQAPALPPTQNNPTAMATLSPPPASPSPLPSATPTRMIPAEANPSISPPTDPRLLHGMIAFGVVAVLTLLIGIWINRERINMG